MLASTQSSVELLSVFSTSPPTPNSPGLGSGDHSGQFFEIANGCELVGNVEHLLGIEHHRRCNVLGSEHGECVI